MLTAPYRLGVVLSQIATYTCTHTHSMYMYDMYVHSMYMYVLCISPGRQIPLLVTMM